MAVISDIYKIQTVYIQGLSQLSTIEENLWNFQIECQKYELYFWIGFLAGFIIFNLASLSVHDTRPIQAWACRWWFFLLNTSRKEVNRSNDPLTFHRGGEGGLRKPINPRKLDFGPKFVFFLLSTFLVVSVPNLSACWGYFPCSLMPGTKWRAIRWRNPTTDGNR